MYITLMEGMRNEETRDSEVFDWVRKQDEVRKNGIDERGREHDD